MSFLSSPRRRGSSDFNEFWIPAFAGMTFIDTPLMTRVADIPGRIKRLFSIDLRRQLSYRSYMNKIPMTPDGHKKLQKRLKHLKAVERPKSVEAIEVARGHGDLSENAEYDAAKEHQSHLSEEIRKIEHELSLAQIIDPSTLDHDKVVFGATVHLSDVETEEKKCYQIVGTSESDINHSKISIESPIARALIGKEPGDVVKVKTPKGIRELEILDVEYK